MKCFFNSKKLLNVYYFLKTMLSDLPNAKLLAVKGAKFQMSNYS
jgi:hypothetical protein